MLKARPTLPLIDHQTYLKALEALNPIMDSLAEIPTHKPDIPIEQGRWQIWLTALLLRRMAGCHGPMPWFYGYDHKFRNLSIGKSTCGRETKKKTSCKRIIRYGRVACYNHMTPQEKLLVRQYQDAIHIPFPRVGGLDFQDKLNQQLNQELDHILARGE